MMHRFPLVDFLFNFRRNSASVVKKASLSFAIIKNTIENFNNLIWVPLLKTEQKNIERIEWEDVQRNVCLL